MTTLDQHALNMYLVDCIEFALPCYERGTDGSPWVRRWINAMREGNASLAQKCIKEMEKQQDRIESVFPGRAEWPAFDTPEHAAMELRIQDFCRRWSGAPQIIASVLGFPGGGDSALAPEGVLRSLTLWAGRHYVIGTSSDPNWLRWQCFAHLEVVCNAAPDAGTLDYFGLTYRLNPEWDTWLDHKRRRAA